MSKTTSDRTFEIALVGDFQGGKSTTFNALLGRSLSPCGFGIKTSACAVTARALAENEKKEYAQPIWRTQEWLNAVVEEAERDDADGVETFLRKSQDFRRVAAIIKRFARSAKLAALQKQSTVEIKTAQSWLPYPEDWDIRWTKDPSGKSFSLMEILPIFLERIVFHIKPSGVISFLPYDLTDAPGFDAGAWDSLLSRETMLRANVLVCVLNGRHRAIDGYGPFMEELLWILGTGHAEKMLFAQNGEGLEREELIARTNAAILRQKGFSLTKVEPITFDAKTAMGAQSPTDVNVSRIIDLFAGIKKLSEGFKEGIPTVKIRWTDGGIPKLSPGYGWNTRKADGPFGLFETIKWIPAKDHEISSCIKSELKEGAWRPAPGYVWDDGDSISDKARTKNIIQVRWQCNMRHRDVAHVVSGSRHGMWMPEEGYEWVDSTSYKSKLKWGVRWMPGLLSKTKKHMISGRTEGTWESSPFRSKDEIISAFSGISNGDLYIGYRIPATKLSNARRSMSVPYPEDVIILFDDTVFGGSREGFLVTEKGVYAKSFLEEPIHFNWNDIKRIDVVDSNLHINSKSVSLPSSSDKNFQKELSLAFSRLI